MGESAELERMAAIPATKPLDPGYFALQLSFAEAVAAKTGVAFAHAVFTHTNFFMRLSFGTRQQFDENHPGWRAFVGKLVGAVKRLARPVRFEREEFRHSHRDAIQDALERADRGIHLVGLDERDRRVGHPGALGKLSLG